MGYGSLFFSTAQNLPNGGISPGGTSWFGGPGAGIAGDAGTAEFKRRFGLARLYERNKNLLDVINNPAQALGTVNNQIQVMADKKAVQYNTYVNEFRALGFGEQEAIARADIMIGRELESELSLLQIKYPYATGGAEAGGWDPVSAVLGGTSVGQNIPKSYAAIKMSGGLGTKKKKK